MIGYNFDTPETKNKTTSKTYLELGFVAANFLILLATFFVGIAANVFVILAVYKQKSLQNSNNALVVNLAVIDFLRCVIDCPVLLTIISSLNQKGHVEGIICDMQVFSFSFSCCIQLLTLACISAERYQAISQPFKTAQRRKRIMVWIPLTWIIAIVVALFCLIFLKDSPVYVRCHGVRQGTLQVSYDTYGLYMVLPLWAACFSIIIAFYTRIFFLLRSHNRKIFDKGIIPVKKKKEESKKTEHNIIQMELMGTEAAQNSPNKDTVSALLTSNLPQCISPGAGNEKENALEVIELEQPCKKAMQDGVSPGESVKPETAGTDGDVRDGVKSSVTNLQQMSHNLNSENQKEKAQNDKPVLENNLDVQTAAQTPSKEPVSDVKIKAGDSATVNTVSPVTKTEVENIEGAVCMMPSRSNRERANKKKESTMAKRAGYIIVTFLLFWLPIITTIILNFALHRNKYIQIAVVDDLEVLSVSVACVTSLSNPIIYAAVNPQFRTEFYRLRNKLKSH